MKKKIFILSILLAVVCFSFSCYKKPNGSFTLHGCLLYQSDSSPVSGQQITVMYKLHKGGFSGETKNVEVGSGKSDSNGSFEILCDYYNEPNYYFKENNLPVDVFIFPKKEGDVVNLDTLYVAP